MRDNRSEVAVKQEGKRYFIIKCNLWSCTFGSGKNGYEHFWDKC